ncbi:hypothetical protein PSPO_a1281 [Pseudoalteromonas spongiae UST010723-006]|nr:hypothetical protein PSPO_a1281 [Pseudoalteromonas spongiae UST010723-006]
MLYYFEYTPDIELHKLSWICEMGKLGFASDKHASLMGEYLNLVLKLSWRPSMGQ